MRLRSENAARGPVAAVRSSAARVCLCAFLCLALVGCAGRTTPLARTVQARELYTSTLHVLTAARAAGRIDDEQARQIESARRLAAAALDEMEAAALAREQLGFERVARRWDDAIDPLLERRLQVTKEAKP